VIDPGDRREIEIILALGTGDEFGASLAGEGPLGADPFATGPLASYVNPHFRFSFVGILAA